MEQSEADRKVQGIINRSLKTTIRPRRFMDTRTGETVTSFNIMDIRHMQDMTPKKKIKRPSKDAPFSEWIQYNVDRVNNR